MANTIRMQEVAPGKDGKTLFEFDFKHPSINKRIRRKIPCTYDQASIIQKLLHEVLDNHYTEQEVTNIIDENQELSDEHDILVNSLKTLYFGYLENIPANINPINNPMQDYINIKYDSKIILIGNSGVGKSSYVKYLSDLLKENELNFPFTEMRRATTFPVDYRIVRPQSTYRLLVTFKPLEEIDLMLTNYIWRAAMYILKKITLHRLQYNGLFPNEILEEIKIPVAKRPYRTIGYLQNQSRTVSKNVFNAFSKDDSDLGIDAMFNDLLFTDTESTDIRYLIGKYIPSAKWKKNDFWYSLYDSLCHLIGAILVNYSDEFMTYNNNYENLLGEKDFLYANTKKPLGEYISKIKSCFAKKITETFNEFQQDINSAVQNNAVSSYETSHNKNQVIAKKLTEQEFPDLISYYNAKSSSSNTLNYLTCAFKNYSDSSVSEILHYFIDKSTERFGKSFFSFINYMRIEIPLQRKLNKPSLTDGISPITNRAIFPITIRDCSGVRLNVKEYSNLEAKTSLWIYNFDKIFIFEDARQPGNEQTISILSQILESVKPSKINFIFSFFDQLNREAFDKNVNLEQQKKKYLLSMEKEAIKKQIYNPDTLKSLERQLNEEITLFWSYNAEHTLPEQYDNVRQFMERLLTPTGKDFINTNEISFKINSQKTPKQRISPKHLFLIYDYKKIPYYYNSARENFIKSQKEIYLENPPHFRTTESLLKNMSEGIYSFSGAQVLHPTDDILQIFMKSFSEYMNVPERTTFIDDFEFTRANMITYFHVCFEKFFKSYIESIFSLTEVRAQWEKLYAINNGNIDEERRKGIIDIFEKVVPDMQSYIKKTTYFGIPHMINQLEDLFDDIANEAYKDYSNMNFILNVF